MLRPWKNNEKLINAVYGKVQNLEGELSQFRRDYEKLRLITELKNEIASKVFLELKNSLPEQLAESVIDAVHKKLGFRPQGVV
jgi:hypothetical protein